MNQNKTQSRVVITGMGILSPIGNSADEVLRSILSGTSAVRARGEIVRGKPVFAGEIRPGIVAEDDSDLTVDRTGRLAVEAAKRALADAFGPGIKEVDLSSVGLALGSSHGGRSQLDRLTIEDGDPFELRAAARYVVASAHHLQTAAVVAALGLGGPTVTLSNACSSSGSALEVGLDWIRSGRCPVALVGGADGYAHLTQAGFAALGATSPSPNAPFSLPVGINLGEAAGFVVIETLDHALARRALVHAELFSCASTWDAYHLTEPAPDGDGLARAIGLALARAGWEAERVGFIHAHGTGTRLNDTAECRALSRFFGDAVPPVCSSKSMTGHVLGASAIVGLVVGIVAMNQGLIPPTVNFTTARPGCTLDFVANVPRDQAVSGFAVQVAGFGGANAVTLAGLPAPAIAPGPRAAPVDAVVITGVGIVSPLGLDLDSVTRALAAGTLAVTSTGKFLRSDGSAVPAALVDRTAVRKQAAGLGLRRAEAVVEFAAVAASNACRQAGLQPLFNGAGERIGLVIGTTRGEAGRFESYLESTRGGAWDQASPLHFPHMVMSALGGQISKALGLKGASLSVADGTTAGLHALCHAAEMLRNHDDLDAIVVVAADELTPRLIGCLDRIGKITYSSEDGSTLSTEPYKPGAHGSVPGEGAVAVVLERASGAARRGARALGQIVGRGLATSVPTKIASSVERSVHIALQEAGLGADTIDLAIGCGRGLPSYDRAEIEGISHALDGRALPCPATALAAGLGVAEACSGLNAIAAALAIIAGAAVPSLSVLPPNIPENGALAWNGPSSPASCYEHVLVAGATDEGNSASVILARVDSAR